MKPLQRTLIYLEPIRQLLNENYRLGYTPARVISKVEQGANIWSFELKVNKTRFSDFTPGQHIALSIQISGRYIDRYFSISSPHSLLKEHGVIEVSMKRNEDGVLTKWAVEHLNIGSTVNIKQPSGNFTLETKPQSLRDNDLFIAAGSGITPILSMMRSQSKRILKTLRPRLIYYFNSTQGMAFQKRLKQLESDGLSIEYIDTHSAGRIQSSHLDQLQSNYHPERLFICGPSGFTQTAYELLSERARFNNKPVPQLITESFGGLSPSTRTSTCTSTSTSNTQHDQSQHQIVWRNPKGQVIETLGLAQQNLLASAEQASLKPIFGCRVGICHQCSCLKYSGRVQNLKTGEISSNGQEAIQLCITAPLSPLTLELKEQSS